MGFTASIKGLLLEREPVDDVAPRIDNEPPKMVELITELALLDALGGRGGVAVGGGGGGGSAHEDIEATSSPLSPRVLLVDLLTKTSMGRGEWPSPPLSVAST
jgi:hypothetical protein